MLSKEAVSVALSGVAHRRVPGASAIKFPNSRNGMAITHLAARVAFFIDRDEDPGDLGRVTLEAVSLVKSVPGVGKACRRRVLTVDDR